MAKVLGDVRGGRPLAGLGKRITLVFARVPDLDEGVFCRWIGGNVNEGWACLSSVCYHLFATREAYRGDLMQSHHQCRSESRDA